MPTRLDIAKKDILALFESLDQRIFGPRELASILAENRDFWRAAQSTTTPAFIDFLKAKGKLQEVHLESQHYTDRLLYTWGEVSPFQIALKLRPGSYLTHGTAVFLHALTDELPRRIYVNQEQSPKPPPATPLAQGRIDAAFARPQRESRHLFHFGDWEILVLSGKSTDRLEVRSVEGPQGDALDTTGLERTLIDIAVRPAYAGGVYQVLAAYRAARGRASTNVLLRTLKLLDYVYPYHQAIGFYMEKAGWDDFALELMKRQGLEFDFYLTYGMKKPAYDPKWRLFYPQGLE